MGKVMLEGQ